LIMTWLRSRAHYYLLLLLCLFWITPAHATQKNILVLGDSISAAYGMSLQEGWVALLQQRLEQEAPQWHTINASISGETSAGAAARLPDLLRRHQPDIVILELGGNDGLRGYPIKQFRNNLRAMAEQSIGSGARILLLGMQIPPNYGARYTLLFSDSYPLLAEDLKLELVPFLLEEIATQPLLMQADRIHPTAEAQQFLLNAVWPKLELMISE
jgi:acyl-CoA thioesterase-1